MSRVWALLLGRILALLQGVIWFATLSGTGLRVGWLFGLLALAAAIAARRIPNRSALLLIGPASFVALLYLTGLARSGPPQDLAQASLIASLVIPGVIAATLIRTAAPPSEARRSSTLAGTSTHIPIRRAVAPAVLLASISIVPVALSLHLTPPAELLANDNWAKPPIDWRPMGAIEAVGLTTIVVLVAALIGGAIGGFVWRSGRIWGGVAALASAWAASIIVMPLSAAALGIQLRTGIICIFGCEALLRDDQPFGGPVAYVEFLVGTATLVWPLVALAVIVVVVVTVAAARSRGSADGSEAAIGSPPAATRTIRSGIAVLLTLAGFAVVHGAGLALTAASRQTGVIPYVCLSFGVLAWAAWMDHRSVGPPPAAPACQPANHALGPESSSSRVDITLPNGR